MFPYRDENPALLTPVVTVAIIVLNLVAWVFLQGMGAPGAMAQSICELGLTPGDLMHRLPLGSEIPLGRGMACVITEGTPWRTVVTSMFLHGGWLHLLGNMWFLWVFGNNVEDALGHGRFAAFYLLSGLGGAATQVLLEPGSPVPMVGASGAISGVMGAYALLYPRVRIHTLVVLVIFFFRVAIPAWVMLGYWFFLQLLSAGVGDVGGGVAFAAHVGGFVTGAVLVLPFRNEKLWRRRSELLSARAWAQPGGLVR
jgi:membrane associated rhomboid family serine protease